MSGRASFPVTLVPDGEIGTTVTTVNDVRRENSGQTWIPSRGQPISQQLKLLPRRVSTRLLLPRQLLRMQLVSILLSQNAT